MSTFHGTRPHPSSELHFVPLGGSTGVEMVEIGPRVLSHRSVHEEKWLRLEVLRYSDEAGNERVSLCSAVRLNEVSWDLLTVS